MGLRSARSEVGGSNAMVFVNFIWRVLQFLIGLIVLIMYAIQPAYALWSEFNDLKFSLGIAAGALALATTPFLAIIPFFFGYQIVAYAFIWDFIVMAVYAGLFAYFKARFPYGETGDIEKDYLVKILKFDAGRIDTMRAAVTLDLIGMLLWLITFLMAVSALVWGCVRGRSVKN